MQTWIAAAAVWPGRGSEALIAQPTRYVVKRRGEDAGRKARPEEAQQHHRIRALQRVDVDEMRHGPTRLGSPTRLRCARVYPAGALFQRTHRQSRVATPAWLYRAFTPPLCWRFHPGLARSKYARVWKRPVRPTREASCCSGRNAR